MTIAGIDTMENAYKAIHEINQAMSQIWFKNDLFSWRWWLSVVLVILPWALWVVFRKKDSTSRLLYVGFAVMLIASWLDFIGVMNGLWSYKYSVVPTMPTFIPADFSLIPVTIMSVLQFKPNINPYLKAVVLSGMTSFVGEPIFKWLELYNPKEWKHIYSFIIYVGIYLLAHFMSRRKHFAELADESADEYDNRRSIRHDL